MSKFRNLVFEGGGVKGIAYGGALIKMQEMSHRLHIHQNDWERTIYIDSREVKATDFDLSEKIINSLIENGKIGVEKYFEWRKGCGLEFPK